MSQPPTLNIDEKREGPPPGPVGPGLDPVTGSNFAEIVAPHEGETTGFYDRSAAPSERSSQFSPMMWAMIVLAGIVLGFVIALMLAGI
jgi:hypothetical protein